MVLLVKDSGLRAAFEIQMERIEYFYIIEHKRSGKRYAGSKYAKYCHPDQLLNPNHHSPYYTSSDVVKALIAIDGINSFDILRIKEFPTGGSLEYEHRFLRKIGPKNDMWLNGPLNLGRGDPKPKPFAEMCFDLGKQIKERRRNLGLSQDQLAKLCEITRVKVIDCERGKMTVAMSYYAKISAALDCAIDLKIKKYPTLDDIRKEF